ncbi:MAG: DUF1460 domain-containing protein [Verrucomicrobiales bacterium]|nr:DUF1460 domain-containing protein [Verrucomicrobiales bacterium]
MKKITRRRSLALGILGVSGLSDPLLKGAQPGRNLPLSTVFKGKSTYHRIVAKAIKEGWRKRPIHQRMILFARELHGTPYVNYTLEIDDHIESPSANFEGLDCWTFFEITLGLSRMIMRGQSSYSQEDLLREIRWTRYRGGSCSGNYLERIHYLAEWFFENEARGNVTDITRELGYAERISGRKISEMTILWKHYRYLRENPELREPMKKWEAYVAKFPVYYIPKSKVAVIEPKLQDGDIIGIVTGGHGGFCSHVGLIIRTNDKVTRFMHASRNYKKVVIDKSISGYLNSFRSHAGIMVARPQEVGYTVTDQAQYQKNLKRLRG